MNQPTARTHIRPASTSRKRLSNTAGAHETLAAWGKNLEADVATFGQFSIIDAIEAVLDRTGPADVTIATWTAAEFDLTQIEQQMLTANIRSLRLIIDRSFVSRQPKFVDLIHQRFGEGAVRSTRTHAKFILIRNAEWDVVIRTSMNLNHNPRLEYMQVADDRELADFWESIADAIFDEEAPGLANRRNLPRLAGVDTLDLTMAVTAGNDVTTGPLAS